MSDNRFDNLKSYLETLSDEELKKLSLLPGFDMDDYIASVISEKVLKERGIDV